MVAPPENELERISIEYLRNHLPDENYTLYTNRELIQGKDAFEVDIILVTPHCVYIIDIKGVHGTVTIDQDWWHIDTGYSYQSPLRRLRKNAKILKTSICNINKAISSQLDKICVTEAIILPVGSTRVIPEPGSEHEAEKVIYLNKQGVNFLKDRSRIQPRFTNDIRPYLPIVYKAIQGRSRDHKKVLAYQGWKVEGSPLAQNSRYTEYQTVKDTFGEEALRGRLRLYKVDLFMEPSERQRRLQVISTAFNAVKNISPHPNVLGVQDIFPSADGDGLVIVFDDTPGQSLSFHIAKKSLNLDDKFNIIRDILHGLEQAHRRGVFHRNITPEAVILTPTKQAKLTNFDFSRMSDRGMTIAHEIVEELEEYAAYQAFECYQDPSQASPQSDLFSAGLVFYEMMTGNRAFKGVQDLYEMEGNLPQSVIELYPELNPGIDQWLQKLSSFDVQDRFPSAEEALLALMPLLSPPKPDLYRLPKGTILNNRFQIIEPLGKPGGFSVVYKVFELVGKIERVLKLITYDQNSVYDRMQTEFSILSKLPKHPHVVDVIWAEPRSLEDYEDTPYIVFEFVEGEDLGVCIERKKLTLDQCFNIARQALSGLSHLHANNCYHQDIKPSNLLLTSQGIKIIDFNISISSDNNFSSEARTNRYIPPDLRLSKDLSCEERVDRDLYAFGITLYESITNEYPFLSDQPKLGQVCFDPRGFEGCKDLSDEVVEILQTAIAPKRNDRFASAEAFLEAIDSLSLLQQTSQEIDLEAITAQLRTDTEINASNFQAEKTTEDLPARSLQVVIEAAVISENASQAPIAKPSDSKSNSESDSLPDVGILLEQKHTSSFDLFSLPAFQSLQTDSQVGGNIILDPAKVYPIPPGYCLIATEADWVRHFGTSESPYWVQGKTLCLWVEEWLRNWQCTHQILEIKQLPKERLAAFLHPLQVPAEWTEAQTLAVVLHLEQYSAEPIASLLADLTESNLQVWLGQPSLENLAQWLAIPVPEKAKPLEQAWQAKRPHSSWHSYYQTRDKLQLLRQWLGIAEPKPLELGAYPFEDVPPILQAEFDHFWERELYRTNCGILDDLDLAKQSASQRIATRAYEVLKENPGYINFAREKQLKGYIDYDQYQDLAQLHRPPEPQLLPSDASPKDALCWVTEAYLPLRRWETVVANLPKEKQVCDRLAGSFEDWMLEHYPSLTVDSVSSSWLNYNVCHQVESLCTQGPVFWVVVDGLGWLDHETLLAMLTAKQALQLEQGQTPRFSILPTKTEYAKWSLYSQRRPGHESWVPDAGKGFALTNGKRYTDNDETKGRLQKDMAAGKLQLYCWDTDRFDSLFHKEVDWQNLYTVKRQRVLRDIADDILRFIDLHPQKDDLQVVIASDHGQLLGISEKLTNIPEGLEPKGRMAIGKAEHPQLAILDRARFDLPHDISIIRGPSSFSSFSYGDDKSIIGCHGGLYPEEVVVGFSVLRRSVKRAPVIVKCSGEGRPGEASTLKIEIYNPNPLVLEDLKITVPQLAALQSGQALEAIIEPKKTQLIEVPILKWPELPPSHESKSLSLTGELEFRYHSAELASVELDKDSAIEVSQIFSSGIEGLDDFF